MRINTDPISTIIYNAYAPHAARETNIKDKFYGELTNVLHKRERHEVNTRLLEQLPQENHTIGHFIYRTPINSIQDLSRKQLDRRQRLLHRRKPYTMNAWLDKPIKHWRHIEYLKPRVSTIKQAPSTRSHSFTMYRVPKRPTKKTRYNDEIQRLTAQAFCNRTQQTTDTCAIFTECFRKAARACFKHNTTTQRKDYISGHVEPHFAETRYYRSRKYSRSITPFKTDLKKLADKTKSDNN